jgi:hypothetical protein
MAEIVVDYTGTTFLVEVDALGSTYPLIHMVGPPAPAERR